MSDHDKHDGEAAELVTQLLAQLRGTPSVAMAAVEVGPYLILAVQGHARDQIRATLRDATAQCGSTETDGDEQGWQL